MTKTATHPSPEQRVALYARSIGDARWTEVDDHDDLARARALVREGL